MNVTPTPASTPAPVSTPALALAPAQAPAPTPIAGLEPTLPTAWYRSEEAFRAEKQRIFWREWMCAGREEELPAAGTHRVLDIAGESILLLRNQEGALRGFYNVCRHRGTRLCHGADVQTQSRSEFRSGVVAGRRIVCPYHQWAYDLDGHLLAAPHLAGLGAADRAQLGLHPVAVGSWGGFVFVNLTPAEARPLAVQLGPIPERLQRYPLAELRIGHTIQYQVGANWKALCENYNECYHCAPVHPELCAVVPAFREAGGSQLDWSRGIPHRPGAYTFTTNGTTSRRRFPGLSADEQTRHKGELAYPNLFLSLACDHAAVFILHPRGPARTDIICHFLFEQYELARPDFNPSDAVEFWDVINQQDWRICELVQQGMQSRVHEHGYYAPMEDAALDIRRYIREKMGAVATAPSD